MVNIVPLGLYNITVLDSVTMYNDTAPYCRFCLQNQSINHFVNTYSDDCFVYLFVLILFPFVLCMSNHNANTLQTHVETHSMCHFCFYLKFRSSAQRKHAFLLCKCDLVCIFRPPPPPDVMPLPGPLSDNKR